MTARQIVERWQSERRTRSVEAVERIIREQARRQAVEELLNLDDQWD